MLLVTDKKNLHCTFGLYDILTLIESYSYQYKNAQRPSVSTDSNATRVTFFHVLKFFH